MILLLARNVVYFDEQLIFSPFTMVIAVSGVSMGRVLIVSNAICQWNFLFNFIPQFGFIIKVYYF